MGSRGQQGGINPEDQAFLSQIEDNIRGQKDDRQAAKEEAEQRAREMDRIRQATANLPQSALRGGSQSAPQQPASAPAKKNPLEDDPRYKEYFERLRRQKGEETPTGTSSVASGSSASATPVRSQSVGPGAIVRFDDGSIGVYKDAVSGKDYALFYFLHPDGQFLPEGVFLKCYQAKVLGNLPENYFSTLRDASEWDRDVVVFHLDEFEFVAHLNDLKEHQDRKPPKPSGQAPTPAGNISVSQSAVPPVRSAEPAPPPEPAPAPEPEGLVKGRRFQIKFGGKMWEAVYWMEDEQGAIVAHNTHGDWSLMRLDLSRFSDSLELNGMVDDQTLTAIANSAP